MEHLSSENLWIVLLAAFSSFNLIMRGLKYSQAAFKKMNHFETKIQEARFKKII